MSRPSGLPQPSVSRGIRPRPNLRTIAPSTTGMVETPAIYTGQPQSTVASSVIRPKPKQSIGAPTGY